MTDEVKKLMEQATAERTVPFEPALHKRDLMRVRAHVSERIAFYNNMAAQGFPIFGGVESCTILARAIDNYLRVATTRQEPDPSPDEWWGSVLGDAQRRSDE
jgi:hypothetical protein